LRQQIVAEGGGEVEKANGVIDSLEAGEGGAVGAEDQGGVETGRRPQSRYQFSEEAGLGDAVGPVGNGDVEIADFGLGEAVGAVGECEVKNTVLGGGVAVVADGDRNVPRARKGERGVVLSTKSLASYRNARGLR
jgi:hypothetical protein